MSAADREKVARALEALEDAAKAWNKATHDVYRAGSLYDRAMDLIDLDPVALLAPEDEEGMRDLLMLGGRSKSPAETLKHLEDAAWESRMDGGCHSPRSEVLTTWARELRARLQPTGSEE